MIHRRAFILGVGAALAAPAIVPASSLMKIWVSKPKVYSTLLELEPIQWKISAIAERMVFSYGASTDTWARLTWDDATEQLRVQTIDISDIMAVA